MTAFRRGDVVRRGRARAIVWIVIPSRLLLLPVVDRPDCRRGADVRIEAVQDLVACAARHGAIVRVADMQLVDIAGQTPGERVSGHLIRQLAVAVHRAAEERVAAERWGADFRHRAQQCEPASGLF